jgi:hypothetical protein
MSGILVGHQAAIQLQELHTITRLIVHLDKSVMVCNNIFHLSDYLHYKMVTEQTGSIYAQVLHFLYTCTVKVQLHNAIFYLIS